MHRITCIATIASLLCFTGAASATESGGAGVPRTARQVLDAGGAVYTPAPPKPKSKPKSKPKPKSKSTPRPKRKPAVPAPVKRAPAAAGSHQFPVSGPFSLGGADGRFGAPRSGHTHQGQDLSAAEGTPVVAPIAGVVQTVQYQASGAGHYVVLDSDTEDRDYVFMHLRSGSIPVRVGQRVAGGSKIGEVGNTGRSFGAHLHFEIWNGAGWYSGGKPIDPYPLLRLWAPR